MADGGQVIQYSGDIIVTSSDDGRTLNFWNMGRADPQIPELESVRRYNFWEALTIGSN